MLAAATNSRRVGFLFIAIISPGTAVLVSGKVMEGQTSTK